MVDCFQEKKNNTLSWKYHRKVMLDSNWQFDLMGLPLVKGRWYNMERALKTTAIQSCWWHLYKIINHCRHQKTPTTNYFRKHFWLSIPPKWFDFLNYKVRPQIVSGQYCQLMCQRWLSRKKRFLYGLIWKNSSKKNWLWKISELERTSDQKLCQQDCCHFFSHFLSYRSQSSSSTSSSGQQLLDGLQYLTSVKEKGPNVWRHPKGFDQSFWKTNVFFLENVLLQMLATNPGILNYCTLIGFFSCHFPPNIHK